MAHQHLFPSALRLYQQCPKRYYFEYIERRHTPTTPALFIGDRVHKALEEVYELPQEERTLEKLQDLLRHAWGAPLPRVMTARDEAFSDTEEEKQAGQEGLALLKNFFQNKRYFWREPMLREKLLTWDTADGYYFGAKVDRVDQKEDGTLEIIDYKTGQVPDKKRIEINADFQIALPMQYLAVQNNYDQRITRVAGYFLRENTFIEYEINPENLRQAKELIRQLADRIKDDQEYLPQRSALCHYCPFEEECLVPKEVPF
ncbi:MAG: PD-(D/E)XK nuclease family protein [Halanaerobium sp.]|nr:PD-(D/E)XK nuclease family protein [Halanaerobium sp.]